VGRKVQSHQEKRMGLSLGGKGNSNDEVARIKTAVRSIESSNHFHGSLDENDHLRDDPRWAGRSNHQTRERGQPLEGWSKIALLTLMTKLPRSNRCPISFMTLTKPDWPGTSPKRSAPRGHSRAGYWQGVIDLDTRRLSYG
jgi:hypothetical protein